MLKVFQLFILSLVLLVVSCQDDDDGQSPLEFIGYQYLPIEVGQENIYQVDSIKYDDFANTIDTIRFQQREVVASTFTDNANRLNYVVNVFQRANDTLNWTQVKAISKTRTNIRYELKEDNLITIPLVFPISLNKKWNSNALNVEDELTYRYKEVHEPLSQHSMSFDSTVTISQRSEENLIERIFTEEKYATQIGLISRKDIDLRTELNGDIKSGYEATITLIEFKP